MSKHRLVCRMLRPSHRKMLLCAEKSIVNSAVKQRVQSLYHTHCVILKLSQFIVSSRHRLVRHHDMAVNGNL